MAATVTKAHPPPALDSTDNLDFVHELSDDEGDCDQDAHGLADLSQAVHLLERACAENVQLKDNFAQVRPSPRK